MLCGNRTVSSCLNQCVCTSKMNSLPPTTPQAACSSYIASGGTQSIPLDPPDPPAAGVPPDPAEPPIGTPPLPPPDEPPVPLPPPSSPSSELQPLAKLMHQRAVAMPMLLAMNSRRSIPTRRAFSSAFRRISLRSFFSWGDCGMKYSPFECGPIQIGDSYGSSGIVFVR